MRILFTSILIIFYNCILVQAQQSSIRKIDSRKNYVDKNIKRYKKKTTKDSLGTYIGYYNKKGDLVKLRHIVKKDTESKYTDFYYINYHLVLLVENHYIYNKPKYWTKKFAKQNGLDGYYDVNKTKKRVCKYYLKDNRLISYVRDGKEKDIHLRKSLEKTILHLADEAWVAMRN